MNVLGHDYALRAIAQKRGVQIFQCPPGPDGRIPDHATRGKIEKQVAKQAYEHLIIVVDNAKGAQIWQWVARAPGQPALYREHTYDPKLQTAAEALIQKLRVITIPLGDEEALDLTGTVHKLRDAFDRDRVTKKFYDRFKIEHGAFLAFIKGVADQAEREWYASLMLNRLMFIYFIQRKGFLDGKVDHLRDRLARVQARRGKGKFHTFYRYFLLALFHEGFAKEKNDRALDADLRALLGAVPYLNGGLFEVHALEERNPELDIPDEAFRRLFDFFDQWDWHLDVRPLRNEREINPDVLGYIFEKYINQKQMGAYYTKEDITEYISKSTIVPYLFDAARKGCAVAFEPSAALWRLLSEDPDRYIYPAVRRGVVEAAGQIKPLPDAIAEGVTDVSKRGGWNRPAPEAFALPTETWREHVARRERCLEIREKLRRGEVHEIDDLVTLNLDLRQLAEDAISGSEGPELLRAFWHAIRDVTVLDPTCGSGAFLFAALGILQPLYEACLDRMQAFVDDLGRSGTSHSPKKFSDFRAILAEIDRHPNRDYFILKSLIVGNLYGVDIMEEAVEICKLRLFLKLVAQVEDADQLEPLPDVDFNVRAGNTLVGFATLDDVKKSLNKKHSKTETIQLMPGFDEQDQVKRIVEDAEIVDRAFQQFHEQQTKQGVKSRELAAGKKELRDRLNTLGGELDRYLASEYGIDADRKPKDFASWRASHQPFHWFAEFHGIMKDGGFDVIIGNPPYVEIKEVRGYSTRGYECLTCGNLYALTIERCMGLGALVGRQGFIVPVSSISTDRYQGLKERLASHRLWFSSFDDRPSRLFDGLEHIRLTIHIVSRGQRPTRNYSSRYNKWAGVERPSLFEQMALAESVSNVVSNALPKLCSSLESSILKKLAGRQPRLSSFLDPGGDHSIFYSRKVGYFLQVLDFQPKILDGRGQRRPPSEFKTLNFAKAEHSRGALCCLNSNLFYWFVTVFSDCRHVNKREVDAFPIDLESLLVDGLGSRLDRLGKELMSDLAANSEIRKMRFAHDDLTVQCIIPKASKVLIDRIDVLLAEHYGFSSAELDFIINYDIKYRMGADAGEDDE